MDLIAFFVNLSNSINENRERVIMDLKKGEFASCREKDPEHQDNIGNSPLAHGKRFADQGVSYKLFRNTYI